LDARRNTRSHRIAAAAAFAATTLLTSHLNLLSCRERKRVKRDAVALGHA
jgi:hypothetical protein